MSLRQSRELHSVMRSCVAAILTVARIEVVGQLIADGTEQALPQLIPGRRSLSDRLEPNACGDGAAIGVAAIGHTTSSAVTLELSGDTGATRERLSGDIRRQVERVRCSSDRTNKPLPGGMPLEHVTHS